MITKENFKSTFAIIHLSDLHIVSHNNDYSTSLHKMIDHISDVTKKISKIIIVFTGDLVEKGNFKDSKDTIIKFFKDLYKKLSDKIIDIVFTPGNHDKKRGSLLLKNLNKENDEKFWGNFKNVEWKYFSEQFKDFLEITENVRKNIFHLKDTFNGSYGIHITPIENFKICFLCINSAWLCMDEHDEGNLRVGRFQLDDLMSQYQAEKSNIDLVIALMHHPTDWLTKDEQKYLSQYMTDEYRLNTNIMLQGHIHEKETYNWYNQNHSLTTLVTGMGWDQQKEINDNGHRYSLYEINMDSSIVRVNTFVSDNTGKFKDDTEVYKDNNIIFPLFVHKYLEMNKLRFNESEYPLFYPNYNIADNYEYITDGVNKFSINMVSLIKDFKYEYLTLKELINIIKNKIISSCNDGKFKWSDAFKDDIKDKYIKDEKVILLKKLNENIRSNSSSEIIRGSDFPEIIIRLFESLDTKIKMKEEKSLIEIISILDDYFEKYINIYAKEKFYTFIGSLCLNIIQCIFKKEMFDNNSVLRVHCRIVNTKEEEIKYKKIFSYSMIKEEGKKRLKPITDSKLSDIIYENSMIEKSFKLDRSMLCSLNPSSNVHETKEDWIDFMTISPNNDNNIMKLNDDEKIPYLSFGISVNSYNLQTYLRELAFIGFDKLLSNLLNMFFNNISFNIDTLLEGSEVK